MLHIVNIKANNVIGGYHAIVVRIVDFSKNAEREVDKDKSFRLRI